MRARVRAGVLGEDTSGAVWARGGGVLWAVFCIVLAGASLLSFWPCLANDFNYDDTAFLLENPHYRGLGATQLRWMFSTFHFGHYQPLTWISLGLDYLLWGMNAWGYHLTSLLLHCANAILVYWLALSLMRRAAERGGAARHVASWHLPASALVAALVYSLHPLRVETVAWVTDRADVLSTFFLLLCTLSYLRAARAGTRMSRAGWLTLAVMLYAAGLLSRGMGVPLPLVLLLLDWYPLGRLGSRSTSRLPWPVLLEKIPFVILAIAAAVMAPIAKATQGLTVSLAEHGVVARLAQAAYGLVFYIYKTVVPTGLVPIYELRLPLDIVSLRYLGPLFLVLAAGVVLIRYWRRWPAVTVALLSYAILISPLLGLVQAGTQEVADRYSYWPAISLAILLGGGCFGLLCRSQSRNWARRLLFAVSGAVVVLLGVLSWRQSLVWRSEESLWTHAVRNGPVSSAAHYNLGYVYANHGRVAEAMAQFDMGRRINRQWSLARLMAGQALARAHAWPEACQIFGDLLALEPEHAVAATGLGEALTALQRPAEAEAAFRQALRTAPSAADAWLGLGNALVAQRRLDEAAEALRQAVRFAPQRASANGNLGLVLAQLSRFDEAETYLRRAVELDPDYFEGYLNLANLLQIRQRPEEAAHVLGTALRLRPDSAEAQRRLTILNQQRGAARP